VRSSFEFEVGNPDGTASVNRRNEKAGLAVSDFRILHNDLEGEAVMNVGRQCKSGANARASRSEAPPENLNGVLVRE
jgi:hypothetical protein